MVGLYIQFPEKCCGWNVSTNFINIFFSLKYKWSSKSEPSGSPAKITQRNFYMFRFVSLDQNIAVWAIYHIVKNDIFNSINIWKSKYYSFWIFTVFFLFLDLYRLEDIQTFHNNFMYMHIFPSFIFKWKTYLLKLDT